MNWWIFYAKPKLISFLKWKTSLFYKDYRDTMELYYALLRSAYDNLFGHPEQLQTINKIKAQMLDHQRKFSAKHRYQSECFIGGENTTIYHVGELKRRKAGTSVEELEHNGRTISEPSTIKEHLTSYFENLYTGAELNDRQQMDFKPVRKIPDNNMWNRALADMATSEEVYNAIKASASRKSPGPDGITKEFYARTWHIISTEITAVINDAINGTIPKQFMDGVIVLVRKKQNRATVNGFRPISLLNVDYKILARILKQRMVNILPLVLSSKQKCSNGKKNIFGATARIVDKLCDLEETRGSSLLISFDMDHAFDRVDQNFLKQTMLDMQFNPDFVQLVSNIMANSFSKVLINGFLSREIKIQRSVRQGDPLSMFLFVIYLQPLLDKLSSSFPNAIINAYADDISMFVQTERELVAVMEVFAAFELTSGAILNTRKTVALMIGDVNLTTDSEWLTIENEADRKSVV